MTDHDLKALTLEGFERMFNQGDLDYVDRALGRDAVDHQEAPGADFCNHLKRVVTGMRTAFPDLRFEVHAMVREGDVVACRSTMTGTHQGRLELGPFADVDPAGARVAVPHMHFFRYEGGRVADLWHVWDTGILMTQLRPSVAAERAPA